MIAIFEQVFILVVFCLTGFVLCKAKLVKPEHSKPLSVLLVYVFFPCMSFNTFSAQFNVAYLQQRGTLILVSVGMLAVMVVGSKIVTKLLGGDPYTQNVNEYSMSTGARWAMSRIPGTAAR